MDEYKFGYLAKEHMDAWHQLVGRTPASGFHQSFYYSDLRRTLRWTPYKVGLFDSSNVLRAGAIIQQFFMKENESFLYIPHGPVVNYENEKEGKVQWDKIIQFCEDLAKQNPEHGITHLRVEPQLTELPSYLKDDGWGKSDRNDLPKSTTVIDLSLSKEEMLANMKQKCRYNVRLAEKKGVSVEVIETITPSDLSKFYELYSETVVRNEFKGKPKLGFENMMKTCHPILKMFVAKHQGDVLATAIVICFGGRVTYFYGASSDDKKNLMAPYLLHWKIISWAKENGYKAYDLWGISPKEARQHSWQGLSKFKLQFGGERKDYIGAYSTQISGIAKP